MNWKHGYYADSGYTYGFYAETMPWRLHWAALLHNHLTPAKGFRYLDTGCGQGLNLILAALNHPDSEFVGIDFLPEHIAHATALAERCGLKNVRFIEGDFVQLADDPADLGTFDYAVAHGITSWIAPPVKAALFRLIGRVLKPGGLCYNSYNTHPGWLGTVPFQHLVLLEQRHHAGSVALERARTTTERLKTLAPNFFAQLPQLDKRLAGLDKQDPAYLVQEYNNQFWQPVFVSQMIDDLAREKLDYLGTATLPEAFDGVLPAELRALLDEQPRTDLREQLRDYALVQSFRRDLYVKGRRKLWPRERARLLGDQRFIANPLTPPPEAGQPFVIKGGALELKGDADKYGSVYQALAKAPARQGLSLAQFAEGSDTNAQLRVLQIITLLLHGGWVLPVGISERPAKGNQALIEAALTGAPYKYLAAPQAGTAITMKDTDWMLYQLHQSKLPANQWPEQILKQLAAHGKSLARDGQPITDAQERQTQLTDLIRAYASKHELLKTLGAA